MAADQSDHAQCEIASDASSGRDKLPILLTNGYVLGATADALEAADVLIEHGVIKRVAAPGSITSPAARQLDASGCLILPGLTNAHTHSPENLASGFCDGMQLDAWLQAVWTTLDQLPPDAIHAAVLLGAAQMLKRGVTAVVDHFRQTPMTFEAIDRARAAYQATGMRALLAIMLRDRIGSDGRLVGAAAGVPSASIAQARELWTEAAQRHDPRSRVAMALGPSGATRCSDAMLELAVELAERHSLSLHTHVAETRSCAETALELYGCRTVRHLDALGFLGPRTSLAHCVWIDEEEVALIARSGAVAVHNPVSNMVLGTGIAPVHAMIEAGVHVAIGTDGAASNGGQNLMESIKCAALLPRCGTAQPRDWLTAAEAMRLAIGGGRMIFNLGSAAITHGAVADVAVFPLVQDAIDTFFDPVRQLVYGAQTRSRHVLVEGDPIVVDGAITSFDEAALQPELHRIRNHFMEHQRGE